MKLTRSGVPDFKRDGKWIKSFCTREDGVQVQNNTRAILLYNSMKARCRLGSSTYSGSIFGFGDFQSFTDWCQDQPGYMNKEDDGRFWAIDKDWLSPHEPLYSEDTCLFAPVRVNALTVNHKSDRSLPLGVSFYTRYGNYSAICGRSNTLGYFDTPEQAHKAWQVAQSKRIRAAIEEGFSLKLKTAMLDRAIQIENDILSRIETKYA
jgi:hypothetical protein